MTGRGALLRFTLWMVFAMLLFHSVVAAVDWWENPDAPRAWWQWLSAAALPVWVGVYLRYFSVLGGCRCDGQGRPPE